MNGEKCFCFVNEIMLKGVMWCLDVGYMIYFDFLWDGVVVLDRMVCWVILGGLLWVFNRIDLRKICFNKLMF